MTMLGSIRAVFKPGRCLLRTYHPGPAAYGRYDLLLPSAAITSYPDPLPAPEHIARPGYVPANFWTAPWGEHDVVELPEVGADEGRIKLGTAEEEGLRRAGRMVAEVLNAVRALVKPGVTTAQLDQAVHALIIARGAYPSPLGFSSFPKSCTTSVNNVIAHLASRPLRADDIVNVDLTLYLKGYHGDSSMTFCLPEVDKPGRDLVTATTEALELGIRTCGPGKRFSDIGNVIEAFATRHSFSVNSQFSGHGIGRHFHQQPWIWHIRNTEPGIMVPGDCFTIEPCLVLGSNARGTLWNDGWTMSTESGARSAQAEHQVLVTHDGVQVLTRRPGEEL